MPRKLNIKGRNKDEVRANLLRHVEGAKVERMAMRLQVEGEASLARRSALASELAKLRSDKDYKGESDVHIVGMDGMYNLMLDRVLMEFPDRPGNENFVTWSRGDAEIMLRRIGFGSSMLQMSMFQSYLEPVPSWVARGDAPHVAYHLMILLGAVPDDIRCSNFPHIEHLSLAIDYTNATLKYEDWPTDVADYVACVNLEPGALRENWHRITDTPPQPNRSAMVISKPNAEQIASAIIHVLVSGINMTAEEYLTEGRTTRTGLPSFRNYLDDRGQSSAIGRTRLQDRSAEARGLLREMTDDEAQAERIRERSPTREPVTPADGALYERTRSLAQRAEAGHLFSDRSEWGDDESRHLEETFNPFFVGNGENSGTSGRGLPTGTPGEETEQQRDNSEGSGGSAGEREPETPRTDTGDSDASSDRGGTGIFGHNRWLHGPWRRLSGDQSGDDTDP